MDKDLNYYKKNAEEDYIATPISVLKYISELEKVAPQLLTKREQFAMAAMQGMISGSPLSLSKEEAEMVAAQSCQFADALIAELNKKME